MPFDPNASFTVEEESPAGFDPSKPFTVESEPPKEIQSNGIFSTILSGLARTGEAMRQNQLPQAGVPAVTVPRFGEPGTIPRGISEGISGLIEGATTPEGIALGALIPAVPGAGNVIGPLFLGAGAKATGELLGEASVTGNPEKYAEAAVIGGATLLGAGKEAFDVLKERRAVLGETPIAPTIPPLTKAALESQSQAITPEPKPEAPKLPTAEVSFPEPTLTPEASAGKEAIQGAPIEPAPAGQVEPAGVAELKSKIRSIDELPYSEHANAKLNLINEVSSAFKEYKEPINGDEYWVSKVQFDPEAMGFGAWKVTIETPKGPKEMGAQFTEAFTNPDFAAAKAFAVFMGNKLKGDRWALIEGLARLSEDDRLEFRLPGDSLSASVPKKSSKKQLKPAPPSTEQAPLSEAPETAAVSQASTKAADTASLPSANPEITPIQATGQAGVSVGPGAASPGDVPKSSQIAQLTEAIKPTQPVKPSVLSQIKNELGRTYEQISNKAETAIDNLKDLGARSLMSLKGKQDWTNFKAALGKFSGENNRNSFELQQFTREIRRVMPDKLRREAVVNWIQADGDNALLAERAANSDPFRRAAYEVAQKLTPDEMTLANNVRSYLDAKLKEGIDTGLLKEGIENYVSQIWDRPNPITNKLIGEAVSGKLAPNFKFARQRIFDSYFEGEQAGFKPKIKDIGALTAIYDQAFSRAIAGRKLIKALHEGKASDGRPLVEVTGASNLLAENGSPEALLIRPKAKSDELAGYLPIDHPALRGWKWAGTDPETGASILYQGDMVVHPEIHTHLKNVLGSSALRQNTFFRGVLNTQALLKQSKLALSGFHFTQEGTHAAAHRVNPFAPGKIDFSIKDQSALVDHGLEVADYRAYQAFAEGVSGSGSIYERIPGIGKWLTRYNEYLFQEYIPRLKMTMAVDALGRNRERYAGKLSEDQILELTANQSNAAFGALNYDMMGRNKTLQDFFRLAALAPDFLEARVRFAAQALTGTGAEQRHALALQGATLYVAARILNQALTGDPQWDPKNAFEIIYNKRKYGLRSVVEDTLHAVTDPALFISNRLAPASKGVTEFLTGRDWKGVKRTSIEQLKDLASWLIPITADRQADRTKLDTVLAASGVTVRAATAQQRLYEKIKSFKEDNGLISKDEKAGMVSPSEYADLRKALTYGSDEAARREYEALLHPTDGTKPKTATQIREHFINAVRAPFSGSQRVEMQFLKSLDKKGNDLYLEARQERKDLALKFIAKQKEWAAQSKK